VRRAALIIGTLLITTIALLLCLIPKPENDLFFELRIGTDILHSGVLPHFDSYSWVNRGTRWDVPEWLAFVLYALAFQSHGFFGTWALMAILTVAAAWIVWFRLVQCSGPAWAFFLTTLMLLALKDCLQERPYAFTYPLLATSLIILTIGRAGRPKVLLWLLPVCALWANLHQGVFVLVCLLLLYAFGDAVTALWRYWQNKPTELGKAHRLSAGWMLGIAMGCACFGMLSPYGGRIYWNIFITLRDHNLMANVTEWNSAATLPFTQLEPLIAVAVVVFGTLALSQKRTLADSLALIALLGEALLHARNIPLFAIGGLLIAAPHLSSSIGQIRHSLGLSPTPPPRPLLLSVFALLFVAVIALVSLTSLRKSIGPRGYCLEGIGEAVVNLQEYPESACTFIQSERFPPNLRLLNDFETGGFLMWRLPEEPVFIDGRLDVYVGKTFDNMLILARHPGSPAWAALVRYYNFDCVITRHKRVADAFTSDPNWQLVYSDPTNSLQHCRIFLRRSPEFADLIARCLKDHPLEKFPHPKS